MIKKNQKTTLKNADKIENNYKLYIEAISEFYKKEETSQKDKILIGNLIRRVLEIVISFNELNSNNVSIVKDYGKPTLGLIANHLSHENFSKVLTPLPTDDEMKNQSVMMSFWAKSTVSNTIMSWRTGFRGATKELTIGTDWTYYSFQLIAPGAGNATNEAILHIWTDATVWIALPKVERGTVSTDHTEAPEDIQADIASKADQAKVVYKTDISVTDEGIVHSASKTVNGQTIASMIAQRAEWVEIIANLLKVKGDMIVDGTIGANKLSVSTLSALAADLGQISGGSLELLKSEAQGTSLDDWGNFTIPAHKWGLYIDNIGAISSGTPVRKSSSESVASDMPVAVLKSGGIRFARVDQNNDLGSVLHYGLSDPDSASIGFRVASDGTKQLFIQANGQIVNQATNYTGWNSTGAAGVFYKRQGDVVALKLQVTTTANQSLNLGNIPAELVPIPNNGTMMRVTAWTADQSIGRNLQINGDGSMILLSTNRGDTFNTQVTWII